MGLKLIAILYLFGGVLGQIGLYPEYDNPELRLRIFEVHRPLVLFCNLTGSDATLSWTKDGKNVSEIPELEYRFEILSAENKFVIDRTIESDDGLYTCQVQAQNLKADINVIANVAARLPKNTQLIEGEALWIVCRVVGSNPTVRWILPNNQVLNQSAGNIILEHEHGINNSALYIAEVRLEDRGNYTCQVTNEASEIGFQPGYAFGMVRIRDKLAPLYPVGGILVELFILFVVLFIYEKWFHETDDIEHDDDYDVPTPPTKTKSYGETYNKKKAF